MACRSLASRPRSAKVSTLVVVSFADGASVAASSTGNGSSFVSSLRFILKCVVTAARFVGGYGCGITRPGSKHYGISCWRIAVVNFFFLSYRSEPVQYSSEWWGREKKETCGAGWELPQGSSDPRTLPSCRRPSLTGHAGNETTGMDQVQSMYRVVVSFTQDSKLMRWQYNYYGFANFSYMEA